ncbi:MAG: cytochrome P450 [Gammaproteobacteria bacterium]|nr:cytochrome P450 [Gammaproteobacteria bacterium]
MNAAAMRFNQRFAGIPGEPGPPLVGDTFRSLRDPLALVGERFQRYGAVSWARALGMRFLWLLGPDANQLVLQNTDERFANDGWNAFIGRLFPRGLMLLDFAEHRLHRRIMQGAFRREALAGYLARMQPVIGQELARWQPGDGLLAYDHFKRLTLEVGSRVFVGESAGAQADALNRAFFDTVQAATSLLRLPLPGTRWRRGLRGRRLLERFFLPRLPAKRADAGAGDLFAELCRATTEDGQRFSDEDIVNHMIFLLMAAHDTSTITLTNLVYFLAKYPYWQERLREESRTLGSVELEYGQIGMLTSMDLAMRETLRLVAPVPFLPRRTTAEVEFKGYRIPANALVEISPAFTHLLPELWHEPERFDPERFAEGRREDRRHPYAWVPFGGGVHKCIGLHFGELEIKAVLHRLLLGFSWSVPEGYRIRQDHTSLPIPRDRLPITLRRL